MANQKFDILVNKFSLNFKDENLEREFQVNSEQNIKGFVRLSIFIGVFAYLFVLLIGFLTNVESIFFIDGIILFLSGAIFLAFSYSKYYTKYYLLLISFLHIIGVAGMVYTLYGHEKLFLFLFLRILFFTLIPFVTLQYNFISNLIIIALVVFIPVFTKNVPLIEAVENSLIVLPFIMLITLALYLKQRFERATFIKNKQLVENNKILTLDNKMLELQGVIAILLQDSTKENLNLEEFLDDALTVILELSWLKVMPKGSIFLTNNDGDLEMLVSKNLGDLTKTCALVKSGQCLCGKALATKQMLFNNCVTDEHTTRPNGMTPHGHYNVPLLLGDKVYGVLNVYIEHGHQKTEEEEYFFLTVADTLASIIYRHQLEKERDTQANEIIEQNKKIKSSIEYAQRIQRSLLASSHIIKDMFDEVILKFIPKEIVSGDFYFVRQKEELKYISVADCTGHGVPGALVSTVGIQEIFHIIDTSEVQPNDILNRLNKTVDVLLNNDDEIGSDGMDIILLRIDEKSKTIEYAGAKGLFYMYSNDELIRYKTDLYSIGQKSNERIQFANKTISYKAGDIVFLLTDGLIDQISKVDNRRIGSKRIKQLMIEIAKADSNQKSVILDNFIQKHQSNHQIDDITFISFKL